MFGTADRKGRGIQPFDGQKTQKDLGKIVLLRVFLQSFQKGQEGRILEKRLGKAVRLPGIHHTLLYKKIQKYGLDPQVLHSKD